MRAIHKRLTKEDKFGRMYRCQRSARALARNEKRYNRRKLRRILKRRNRDDKDEN